MPTHPLIPYGRADFKQIRTGAWTNAPARLAP